MPLLTRDGLEATIKPGALQVHDAAMQRHAQLLADKLAMNADEETIDHIADRIARSAH